MITPEEEKRTVEIEEDDFVFTGVEVEERQFQDSPVTSIHFNAALKDIGNYAFKDSQITRVTFDEKTSLATLGDFSFSGTDNLKAISLPPLRTIGTCAFQGSGIESINLPENLISIEGMAFINSKLKTLKLPSKVEHIGVSAFEDCLQLRSVILPASLKIIESFAFEGCTNLHFIGVDSDNTEEIEKIKRLLPANLEDKVMSYTALKNFHMGALKPDPKKTFEEQNALYKFFGPEAKKHNEEMGELSEPRLLKEILDYIMPK